MERLPLHDTHDRLHAGDRTVSRRAFFSRARLSLLAVAGVTLFGVASSTGQATADEESSGEKKKKDESRDKDREQKEKEREQEEKSKEKKKKKSSNKSSENGSNTKKKKNKNGDDSNKKKQQQKQEQSASPYAKYVEKKKDSYGCTDFSNQFDAQQVLRLEPKDPNGLDGNRNGIACDGQDAFMDGVAGGLMNAPFDLTPVSRP